MSLNTENSEVLATVIPGYPLAGKGTLPEQIVALEEACVRLVSELAEAKRATIAAKVPPPAVSIPAAAAKPATAKEPAKLFGLARTRAAIAASFKKTSNP